jgi:hypothetical protein
MKSVAPLQRMIAPRYVTPPGEALLRCRKGWDIAVWKFKNRNMKIVTE